MKLDLNFVKDGFAEELSTFEKSAIARLAAISPTSNTPPAPQITSADLDKLKKLNPKVQLQALKQLGTHYNSPDLQNLDESKLTSFWNLSPESRLKSFQSVTDPSAEYQNVYRQVTGTEPTARQIANVQQSPEVRERAIAGLQGQPIEPVALPKPTAFEQAKMKVHDVAENVHDTVKPYVEAVKDPKEFTADVQARAFRKSLGLTDENIAKGKELYTKHISPILSNLQEKFNGLGDFGKPMLAIGGLLLMSHLMGGRRRRDDEEGGGGRNININIGGQGMQNPLAAPGVNSLSSYKLGQEKTADVVTNALSNALKARLTNSVIDKVLIPQQQEDQAQKPKVDDKAVEIVSKYPEMQELLKDEKNKQYLEKLLQE